MIRLCYAERSVNILISLDWWSTALWEHTLNDGRDSSRVLMVFKSFSRSQVFTRRQFHLVPNLITYRAYNAIYCGTRGHLLYSLRARGAIGLVKTPGAITNTFSAKVIVGYLSVCLCVLTKITQIINAVNRDLNFQGNSDTHPRQPPQTSLCEKLTSSPKSPKPNTSPRNFTTLEICEHFPVQNYIPYKSQCYLSVRTHGLLIKLETNRSFT